MNGDTAPWFTKRPECPSRMFARGSVIMGTERHISGASFSERASHRRACRAAVWPG
jgi:hypothetical protein